MLHRDLKPSNVLIDAHRQRAKLADFGQAREWVEGRAYTLDVCTPWYRAPEVALALGVQSTLPM
eukprot:scaffold299401_cov39-Tisochrysis_lutea.AAC.1